MGNKFLFHLYTDFQSDMFFIQNDIGTIIFLGKDQKIEKKVGFFLIISLFFLFVRHATFINNVPLEM